jgi:ribosomal-protein-alanine N-acetyltransferase
MSGSDIQTIFETERLKVRQYIKDDLDNFFLLNGDEEIMRYIRPVKSRKETDLFLSQIIEKYKEDPSAGRWAAEDKYTGVFVGSFAFIPIEGEGKADKPDSYRMQLGYSLLKSNWGKGYATELTLAGLQYVFTKTTLTEIFAVTEAPNTASQKVLLKAGFAFHNAYKEGTKELFQYIFLKQDFRP